MNKSTAHILTSIFPVHTKLSSCNLEGGLCFVFTGSNNYKAARELEGLGLVDLSLWNAKEHPNMYVVTASRQKF